MSGIRLEDVTKRYPNGVKAVDDVSLDIADGEFMVLVGPSGCGKTTLLRMIAGLEEVTAGDDPDRRPRRHRAGRRSERDIAMVFQNYALYPHMTVRENLAFGLKLRQDAEGASATPRSTTSRQTLGLEELLDRKPAALSGGQRQRVAMGRAIVREPKAFLMDEPLSNLDAKLRVPMRAELARLHERLGVTTVYVTHDQVEAMTLGERVAVMRDGVLQQCRHAAEPLQRAANLFVAAFIGSPAMNLVEADVDGGRVHFAGLSAAAAGRLAAGRRAAARDPRHAPDRLRGRRPAPTPACRGSGVRPESSRSSAPRRTDLRDRRAAGAGRRRAGRARAADSDDDGKLFADDGARCSRPASTASGRCAAASVELAVDLDGAALLRPGDRRRAGRPALGAARRLMEHLSAGGVSVVIDDRGQVIHWGAALPDDPATLAAALEPPLPRASFDAPIPLTLTPSRAEGWRGRPRTPREGV